MDYLLHLFGGYQCLPLELGLAKSLAGVKLILTLLLQEFLVVEGLCITVEILTIKDQVQDLLPALRKLSVELLLGRRLFHIV